MEIVFVNGLGALWLLCFMWGLVFLTEMLLLFLPIYGFVMLIRKMFSV